MALSLTPLEFLERLALLIPVPSAAERAAVRTLVRLSSPNRWTKNGSSYAATGVRTVRRHLPSPASPLVIDRDAGPGGAPPVDPNQEAPGVMVSMAMAVM